MSAVTSEPFSGVQRRAEDVEPGLLVLHVGPIRSGSSSASGVAGQLGDRWPGPQVEVGRDLAPLEVEVDEGDASGTLARPWPGRR